jgi:DNA-binding NarL/FixJ family response regulator
MSLLPAGSNEVRHVRTLLVDDDEDMRMLVASIIRIANAGLEIVGEAANADVGFEKWHELRPDVVVVDHRMPGRTGLELAEEILAEEPNQPIVLFSAYLDAAVSAVAAAAGVCSLLDKDRFNDLPAVIRACAAPTDDRPR